ncbi:MAG: hypothetical protein A2941_00550 [Candidatus Yanofskybacteria bacterium RIFCSPLOWO2_01_FULL_49_17]|uniref:Uncharacterized protein n=1 Tax=Candidatus Yanofskybacteria bacterium RIFCSPLOWO2_01_FULL_49_17 TaxID=1802700 RepID=A0A1F8GQZ4_9BACT|nr:MAG: hypothetical protein A2941_00550 [Candidatus Yanofskybacteria bacterium RIFCSPLOWO2_01_FULL_49_17]
MGPISHVGVTLGLLTGAQMAGADISPTVIAASIGSGVFIDGDKIFEIYHRGFLKLTPDITARDRILHSVLAFPFGGALCWVSHSWLPFVALLLHIFVDSFIPCFRKDGKLYPSHPRLKWVMAPWMADAWYRIVPRGWPVQYPPVPAMVYKLAEPVGAVLAIISATVLWWR